MAQLQPTFHPDYCNCSKCLQDFEKLQRQHIARITDPKYLTPEEPALKAALSRNSNRTYTYDELRNTTATQSAMEAQRNIESTYWGRPSIIEDLAQEILEATKAKHTTKATTSIEKETTKVAQNSLYEEYDQMTLRLSSAWNKLPIAEQEKIHPPAKGQSKALKVFSESMNWIATFIIWLGVWGGLNLLWDLLAKLLN